MLQSAGKRNENHIRYIYIESEISITPFSRGRKHSKNPVLSQVKSGLISNREGDFLKW